MTFIAQQATFTIFDFLRKGTRDVRIKTYKI